MARVRRKARASVRVNYELAGIALLAFAAVLAIALVVPSHTGAVGAWTAAMLRTAFGSAAALVPVVFAVVAGIVFLEIQVPRTLTKFGGAAVAYFAIVDAFEGVHGGIAGAALQGGLRGLLGDAGSTIVLIVVALAITVAITKLSLKRAMGSTYVWVRTLMPERSERKARTAEPKQAPRPATLREAFSIPAGFLAGARAPRAARDAEAVSPIVVSETPTLAKVEPPTYDAQPDADASDDDVYEIEDEFYDSEELDADELETVVELDDDDDDAIVVGSVERTGATFDEIEILPSLILKPAVVGDYEPAPLPAAAPQRGYRLPDLSLFDAPQVQKTDDSSRAHTLEDTLASFGVGAKVTHIERGPSITRYELKPERGVKISRISALADDLALALAATSVRIEAPIPGKSAVGIEIPNAIVSIVAIREIFDAFPSRGTIPPLNMALGKDITGRPVFGDLGRMPHLLVAGATGSGKSVCLNGIIASLLVSATPDEVQMLMIDPKRVELTVYNGIPHLIKEVITDARVAAGALFEMTKEMDSRYERFAKASVRKIEEYNAKFPDEKLPYVVIVIDELADLMLIAPAKVETTICRLAQLARATGIHLIVATQRPSVDVITGIIKANIPSRIAFAVSSQIDSRTIIDMAGAERLLGRGDMLYLPIDAPKPVRAQGALVTGAEISRLVEFWAEQAQPPENIVDVEFIPIDDERGKTEYDPLWYDAARFIVETQFASTAQLQTQLSVGHPRAVRIMKQLEELKVVGQHEGTKPRKIIAGLGEVEAIAQRVGKGADAIA